MTGTLRPDEEDSRYQIEKTNRSNDFLKSTAKTALGLGTAFAGGAALSGSGIASKILPFLSKYISPELALKGINKVSPRLSGIIEKGLKSGLTLESGLEYVKNNLNKESKGKAVDEKNIIEKYEPELHSFIKESISKGISPIVAGNKARVHGKFAKAIKQIEDDYKAPWASILESIYGTGQTVNPQEQQRREGLQQFNQKIKKPSLQEQEMARVQGQYGQMGQNQPQQTTTQQPQGNPARDQLLQAMQQLSQSLRQ